MTDVTIRQRTRPDPDAPPLKPANEHLLRWPNGSECYTAGGAGKIEQQWGWIIKRDKEYLTFRRTGPGEDDIAFAGRSPDFGQAWTKLGNKLWSVGYKAPKKAPTVSPEQAPSPPVSDEPAPRVRQRVRPPQNA